MALPVPTTFDIAERVRKRRAELELSQPEFAKYAEVPTHVIFNLETERKPYVRASRLRRLAALLGVTPEWLHPDGRLRGGGRDELSRLDARDTMRKQAVAEAAFAGVERPTTRGDCLSAERRFRLAVVNATRAGEDLDYVRPDGLPDGHNCARPCPFAACKYHTYLDVVTTDRVQQVVYNHPKFDVAEMAVLYPDELAKLSAEEVERMREEEPSRLLSSCVLDVADHGGLTDAGVAEQIGLTDERVKQLVDKCKVDLARTIRRRDILGREVELDVVSPWYVALGYAP